jgi:putative transposase
VYHYFRTWKNDGVWARLQRILYRRLRKAAARAACPSVVIMDGQSVRTTERGGVRGFDGHKRVKGRKRHILVDTLGMLIASRVEPANMSDRVAGARLLSGLSPLFPRIRTVIADAGHESRKLARQLLRDEGWQLRIVKRNQRAFQITGLTWIVERTFAWLGRNRRLSKDYEFCVQTAEAMIDIAAIRLMINRLTRV